MKIWRLETLPNEYGGFILEEEGELEKIKQNFDKGKRILNWTILGIKSTDESVIGDNPTFFWYSNLLLVSERAKKVLYDYYRDFVDFLPVIDKKTNNIYYMINILNIIDVIDYKKSKFKKLSYETCEIIVDVNKYVFKCSAKDIPIFKIYLNKTVKTTSIFVNDDLKKIVEDNKLEGFNFIEAYDFNS